MISVKNISFRAGKRNILKQLSFEANAGEFLVILGNNGAGKSTLLKTICGEVVQQQGNILLHEQDITHYSPAELARKRVVLRQHTAVNLPFRVKEIVLMGRYPYFTYRETPADHAIVESAMQQTGISHLADQNYLTLSGGEQQRVHLARIIAQATGVHQKCILLDEPVNSLDVAHQHHTLAMCKAFAEQGNCVIAVLHDLNLAAMYADTVLLMKAGEVLGHGAPHKIFTDQLITETFGFPAQVRPHAVSGCPVVSFGAHAQPARAPHYTSHFTPQNA